MNLPTSKRNWDKDPVKHYVRRYAWLPAALAQFKASRNAGRHPRYFTFCAANAIDVFLFLKEGLLSRSPDTDLILNTFFCEKDQEEFNTISQLIGPHVQGFLGDFKDLILFKDDEQTKGLDYHDSSKRYPRPLRQRLYIKDIHQRFKASVPFDVLNLDICGSFFPPKGGEQSPMLRSLRTLLDWQTEASNNDSTFNSFTLFLTVHMDSENISPDALQRLIQVIDDNQSKHDAFSKQLTSRFGTRDAQRIASKDFIGFFCTALPKMIISTASDKGWHAQARFTGRYRRKWPSTGIVYSMLAWVARFERHPPTRSVNGEDRTAMSYGELISETILEPENVDRAAVKVKNEIVADLDSIVSLREDYRAGIIAQTY